MFRAISSNPQPSPRRVQVLPWLRDGVRKAKAWASFTYVRNAHVALPTSKNPFRAVAVDSKSLEENQESLSRVVEDLKTMAETLDRGATQVDGERGAATAFLLLAPKNEASHV